MIIKKKKDITKVGSCKKINEELQEEKAKTKTVFRNFADGLLFLEHNRISFINDKAKEFFLLANVDYTGKKLSDIKRNAHVDALLNAIKNRSQPFSKTVLELTDDLILNVSVVPIIYKEEVTGKVIIFHDITRERLIEKMKTEFVSVAAHQLRTPLSAVKWIVRMMIDGDLGPMPDNQKEFLERTYKSNERMIRLVNDLLNVSKIGEGRFLYNVKSENLGKITKMVISDLSEEAEKRGLQLEYRKPNSDIPNIKMDTEKLTLAIHNLVDNAINYTKTGGIGISIKFLKKENNILFTIKDTGIGIPQTQQKRIFSRFFRTTNALKTETEGTGLGLFIAKNIIESHGGKVWFESKENKGSTFFFTLPVGVRSLQNKVVENVK